MSDGLFKWSTTLVEFFTSELLHIQLVCNGFSAEIWDALRAAAEAEISLAQLIVDSAGVIVTSEDLSTCYDERGKNLQGVPVLLPPFASFLEINPSSKIT